MSADSKDEHEWAWEFHKQCDLLLHSRLSAYFIGHSFLLTSFIQLCFNAEKLGRLAPYLVGVVGIFTSIIWLFVNAAMFTRLEALNEKYLFRKNASVVNRYFTPAPDGSAEQMREVFSFYLTDSIRDRNLWAVIFPIRLNLYKYFIPYWTPILFLLLWCGLVLIFHFQLK